MKPELIDRRTARSLVFSAQGFGARRTRSISPWPRVAEMIDRMGVLQIDSVSALARSHYLPVYSRVGPYDRAALDRHSLGVKRRSMFEYWAHEASFLPLPSHPQMRWRMARAKDHQGIYKGLARFGTERRDYIDAVLREIADKGPVTARDLDDPGRRAGPWWGWSSGKIALEYLFWTGEVTAAGRRGFERIYDLPERAIPPDILALPTPAEADAIDALVLKSAQALGIATEADLRDYYRLPVALCRAALDRLVEGGALTVAAVEGWDRTAYLPADADPTGIGRLAPTALVAPFDPLIWRRDRTERLFDFHYRLEFYVPADKRRFGYYVMPFLLRGQLVGRVDLKADRATGVLRVEGAFTETRTPPDRIATALAEELGMLARWLDLSAVQTGERGGLMPALRASVARLQNG